MLDQAINLLVAELNGFLGVRFPGNANVVIASSLCSPDGTVLPAIDNKVVLTLVNVERETVVALSNFTPSSGSGYVRSSPPLYLNLYVLVSASFASHYTTALQLLSKVLGFFQIKPNFDAQNAPEFPPQLSKLSVELVNLNLTELSTLWSTLGMDYMPSMLYKVRMLTIQDGWISEPVPQVSAPDASINGS